MQTRRSFLSRTAAALGAVAVGVGVSAKTGAVAVKVKAVQAKTWTFVKVEDLRAAYGMGDPEQEIIAAMSRQIAMEIDEEILKDLRENSTRWGRFKRWVRRT